MSRTVPSEHAAAKMSDVCLPALGNQLTDVTYASSPATWTKVRELGRFRSGSVAPSCYRKCEGLTAGRSKHPSYDISNSTRKVGMPYSSMKEKIGREEMKTMRRGGRSHQVMLFP